MTLAALIILDDDRPVAPVLGLSWPEFQLRRAVRAGALHLVLVTARVGRDVVEAVDRLRREGFSTSLARTTSEVADLFHPDEAVLLLTGSSIVAVSQLAALLAAPQPALLCIDPERAGDGHELIDARNHWTGIARLDGALVRATAGSAGEWDLGSMLLRKAVAAQVERTMLASGDLLADAGDPQSMATSAGTLIAGVQGATARGWGMRRVVAPLAGLVARSFSAFLPVLARGGPWVATALYVLAPLVAWQQWTAVALAVFLAAILTASVASRAALATGIGAGGRRLIPALRDGVGGVLLALIAVPSLPVAAPVVLALGVMAFMALADRLVDEQGDEGGWTADVPGHALMLFAAALAGPGALPVGIALCALHGLASLAFLQNRLSRVLTSLR